MDAYKYTNNRRHYMSDNKIALLKLSSGEEVVGEVIVSDANVVAGPPHIVLKRPRVMIPTPVGPGQISIQMAPYMVTGEDLEVKIYWALVAGEAVTVPKGLEDAYLQNTSGVQIAPAGSVPKDPQIITG